MPKTMKGPAIFLAQFAGDAAPFNSLKSIAEWAAGLGYKGVQIPTWDGRLFDLEKAAELEDLLRRDQGHLPRGTASRSPSFRPICRASSSPCIRPMTTPFDGFAPAAGARQPEGAAGMGGRADASAAPRPRAISASTPRVTFSGALAWPYLYPWPQRPAGLIETAFDELASAGSRSSTPTTRPASTSATRSIRARTCSTARPSRCSSTRSTTTRAPTSTTIPSHFVLQQLDYLDFIDIYHERIKAFHVKDAEFNPDRPPGRLSRLSRPG